MKKNQMKEFNDIILDNVPASIITIDKNGFITSANKYYQNFAKHKDYRHHNVLFSNFFIREKLTEEYQKLLTDGTIVRRENCHEKNSRGEDKYFRIFASPLRDRQGNITGAISIGLDNTDVVQTKNKLLSAKDELEKAVKQRTKELDTANKKLRRVLDIKSSFMADVSHELRNPLAVIQLELEIISRTKINKDCDLKNPLKQVFTEIKRMSNLLTDLSLLANSSHVNQQIHYENIDINKLINSISKSLKAQSNKKNVKIIQKNKAVKINFWGDKEMMEKLISNLMRNAIKYNKDGGWVKIELKKNKKELTLTVEDGGIGISEESLPYIFDRLYRAENARESSKEGSGLGLAICKLIVELLKGTIEVKSKLNTGTLFTVKLPIKEQT